MYKSYNNDVFEAYMKHVMFTRTTLVQSSVGADNTSTIKELAPTRLAQSSIGSCSVSAKIVLYVATSVVKTKSNWCKWAK